MALERRSFGLIFAPFLGLLFLTWGGVGVFRGVCWVLKCLFLCFKGFFEVLYTFPFGFPLLSRLLFG